MSNLIFSLNATLPVFLMMVLGYVLHQVHWIDEKFASALNRFDFRVCLPILLYYQLANTDIVKAWDTKFVLFCFLVTLFSIAIVSFISLYIKKRDLRGEFIQAGYRSSAAILGIAYISNIYKDASMAPLMIIGAVPLYNIMAVVVLSITDPLNEKLDRDALKRTLRGIVTNPIIIGIVVGIVWSLLRLPLPKFYNNFLQRVGNTATPIGLIAMGASVDLKKVGGQLKNAIVAAALKLVGLELIFLPIAVALGFRTQKLVAILVMLGSATTVSSFVMAKSMHHEGTLTSNTVMITTILSSFTLTFWIYMVRSLGLI